MGELPSTSPLPETTPPATAGDPVRVPSILDEYPRLVAELKNWAAANPLGVLLLTTILGTLTYFYYINPFFYVGTRSAFVWAMSAWNPVGNQAYGALVPWISLGLVINDWVKLSRAPKSGSNWGLIPLLAGITIFVLSVHCLQPRMALVSVPFIVYGAALFVWGKAVARLLLFPCAFLIFMVPAGAVEQATFRLQFIVTGAVGFLSHLLHLGVDISGTTLKGTSFNFEVAEGCSGIRSLMAMVMITAAYVHLTQDRLWKKLVIFAAGIPFAIIGNIGRIFLVVLVARFISPKLAHSISPDVLNEEVHDWSGLLFFPVALAAMLFCDRLLNMGAKVIQTLPVSAGTASAAAPGESSAPAHGADTSAPKSTKYDY